MIKVKRILFPTDFSEHANKALNHAIFLAQRFQAELHLLHVIVLYEDDPNKPEHRFPDLTQKVNQIKSITESRLKHSLENFDLEDLKVVQKSRRGISAYQEIVSYAAEEDIDLIVIGTHGRSGISHLLLGSVAEKVVRYAPCPVLTIGRQSISEPLKLTVDQMLIPVDFSEPSKRAIEFGKRLSLIYNAKIHLFYVAEEPSYPAFYASGKSNVLSLLDDLQKRAEDALVHFAEENGLDVSEVLLKVVSGKPTPEILKYASDNGIDLIVMATHGLSGIDRFIMGSTTEKVIRKTNCPVLVVKDSVGSEW